VVGCLIWVKGAAGAVRQDEEATLLGEEIIMTLFHDIGELKSQVD
jgi:hypothetical protein